MFLPLANDSVLCTSYLYIFLLYVVVVLPQAPEDDPHMR